MSDGALIATTKNAELQALGTGGQVVIQAWDQITSYLRRALSENHAALFAEPNPDPDRGVVDWYAEGAGAAVPLASLSPDAAAAARAELATLLGAIQAEIARLGNAPQSSDRFLGELLALAIQVPNQDSVRVLGGRPVLVAWGHAPAGGSAQPALLIGETSRPIATGPMEIVGPPVEVVRRPIAAWIAAALAGVLLPLLLALAWFDPFRWFEAQPPVCVARADDFPLIEEYRREQEREAALRAQLARLARELGDRRVACPPPPPPPQQPAQQQPAPQPAPPPPQQAQPQRPPPNPDAERARNQGAKSGRVQVILAWDNENDLDLVVNCAGGGTIFYMARQGCGGGELDIDRNAEAPIRRDPVENIVWSNEPPNGRYAIAVMHNGNRQNIPQPSSFRVTLRIEGRPDQSWSGRVGPGGTTNVATFDIPAR
jgi:hypothetical protein